MRAIECDGINKIDVQEGRKDAWHHKTRINPDLTLANCWPSTWEYIRKPLFTEEGVRTPFYAMGISDIPNQIVGKSFGDSYEFIMNREWIEGLTEALKGSDAVLSSVGTIHNRSKRFFSFSSDSLKTMKFGKHEIYSHFFISDCIDKSGVAIFGLWMQDIVCNNTNRMARKAGAEQIHVRHTKNAKLQLNGLLEGMSDMVGFQASIKAEFERLMLLPASEDQARETYAGLIGRGEEIGTRGKNMVNRLTELFRSGAGNEGKSRYDILSGATDYYTHESAGEDEDKQFASSEFGAGNTAKERVFDAVRDNKAFDLMRAAGRATLEKSGVAV